ncbi:hypothetical protein JCM11641_003599 [Rhodosporidiobolus odoratus]
MSSPSYLPYTPKRHGTSSSATSFQQFVPPSTPSSFSSLPTRGSTSFSRPHNGAAAETSSLRAPQPHRPALPAQWSGLSTTSAFTSASSSPSSPPVRPAPSPSTFPFAAVPSTQSPFGTPGRPMSPEKNPVAAVQQLKGGAFRSLSPGQLGKMPYRPGFQPQGVRRDRSVEFFEKRKGNSEARKLDEARLARRLEKLVALHFPPESAFPDPLKPAPKDSALASFSSFSESIRSRTAKELWRSVAANVDLDLERAEQSIVKWQDDKDAARCPICTASFGVRARRHHCRLCGRVVCFLPPTPLAQYPDPTSPPASPVPQSLPTPFRRERCSTFFTYEQQLVPASPPTGEKGPIGVVVEIAPVEQDLSIDGMLGSAGPVKEKDERKKVRVCRDCLNTVMRQQLKTLPVRTPTWLKLYEVIVQLEKEIDEVLPEFQELAITLPNPSSAAASSAPPSASRAKTLRKRLLTDLASYDTLTKRIRDLPLPDGVLVGGSQDRLQRALAARGTLYLSEKLGLLRSLGNIEELSGTAAKDKGKQGEQAVKSLASLLGKEELDKVTEKVGPELEAAAQLQVLREQETLVKSYVHDANSRRQFEDAAALQTSLDELRAEIVRISSTLS